MAEMTTVLTQRSDATDVREFQAPSHTLTVPFLVRQKRAAPKTLTGRASDSLHILRGGVDSSGVALSFPLTITVSITRQANTAEAEMAAIESLLREVVASAAFGRMLRAQTYIQ